LAAGPTSSDSINSSAETGTIVSSFFLSNFQVEICMSGDAAVAFSHI
jgi:hypothetical protein